MSGCNHVRFFRVVLVDVDTYIEDQRQDQDDMGRESVLDRDPANRAQLTSFIVDGLVQMT
jgi:hypothetical protein